MTTTDFDEGHMRAALSLAARGIGQVWPNPAVGCVILSPSGSVVGRGHTQKSGRPHAETMAIAEAGREAQGGTAYVSLEPCSHHGKTPPCADALIAAGIKRCVVAIEDPDPRVRGGGLRRLQEAGIEVETGLLADEARLLNCGYFIRQSRSRPIIAVKVATSLDGKIAMASGESRWITGADARAYGHYLRATYDAILVGSGTILADDPELSCRIPGLEARSPLRIVLDRRGRLSGDFRARHSSSGAPLWIARRAEEKQKEGAKNLMNSMRNGVEFIDIKANKEEDWLENLLTSLAERGLTRLLVEGGAAVATSFLSHRLVDRLYWFRSPRLMGEEGISAIADLGIQRLDEMIGFHRKEVRFFERDVLEILDNEE